METIAYHIDQFFSMIFDEAELSAPTESSSGYLQPLSYFWDGDSDCMVISQTNFSNSLWQLICVWETTAVIADLHDPMQSGGVKECPETFSISSV
jgi:hypothetical protein